MSKVLIICDDFPPFGGIRAGLFAKNLCNLGWHVVIACYRPDEIDQKYEVGLPSNIKTHWLSYNSKIDKEFKPEGGIISTTLAFFRPEIGRTPILYYQLLAECENIIRNEKIDVIFTTSATIMANYSVGFLLSRNYNIPWIADFRDIEEQRPNLNLLTFREKLYIRRLHFRRKKIL